MAKTLHYLFLCVGMLSAFLFGISEHLAPVSSGGQCPVVKYRLVDLGPSGLEQKEVTRLELVFSLAPSVNNLGQVVYNTSQGGYVRDPAFGEYKLKISDAKVFVHALNGKGQLLVSVTRSDKHVEWMLWPRRSNFGCAWTEPELNAKKFHIANLENPESPLFMCTLNDHAMSAGYRQHEQTLIPLTWTPECGLKPMGYCSGLHALGFPRALNNKGTIAGYYQDANDSPPFVWHPCKGINILRDYRSLVQCQGWIDLADLVLTQDNLIYGTYVVKYISKLRGNTEDLGVYFVYRWDPTRDDFLVLDIRNFRIAAVNGANTLVGSYNGKAAMRRQGDEPLELSKMVPDDMEGWELIEATGINDRDQIVGYGTKMGQLHNFLIEPLP
jgi:hypothetical protein